MADNPPVDRNEKPVVVVRRTSFGGSGGGSNSQSKEVGDSSSEASLSVSASTSNQNSPAKKARTSSSSGNKERRIREGHQHQRRSRGEKTNPSSSAGPGQEVASNSQTTAGTGQGASTSGGNKKNKRYSVKKRAPPKEDIDVKPNDVFVNEKSNFLAQLGKCKKIFEKGHPELYLHGLGKAIPRAINLAFELKKFYHDTVDYTVNTSTIELYDDVVDLEDPDQPVTVRARKVSSVDIKVYRCVNIP